MTYRVSALQANEYFLPSCISSSIKTSEIDFILNLDSVLLIQHVVDGYLSAWNYKKLVDSCACSSDRIVINNNSSMDLFVSQVFTDETVLLEKLSQFSLLILRSSSISYSYKLPCILQQQAPILRFAVVVK